MVYKIIDKEEELKKEQEIADKITPEMLGLKSTNDFEYYAQQSIIDENPDKVKEWVNKGTMDIMEAGERFADEFSGDYNNVVSDSVYVKKNFRDFKEVFPGAETLIENTKEINDRKKKQIQDRNQRVNAGEASFFDKAEAFFERAGNNRVEKIRKEQQLINEKRLENNPDFLFKERGKDPLTGQVVYDVADLRKKIGFFEGFAKNIESAVPIIGGYLHGGKQKRFEAIGDKIKKGEQITEGELKFFNRYREDKYEEYIRKYSIAGHIGAGIPNVINFTADMFFGTVALKSVGLAGKGLEAGELLTDAILKTKKAGAVKTAFAKTTGFLAGHGVEDTLSAAIGAILPTNYDTMYSTYRERRLNDKMKITDRGTVIFQEAKEKPGTAFIKSLQSVYISYLSENMGWVIGKPLQGIGFLAKGITKPVSSVGAKQFAKVLKNNPSLEKLIQGTMPIFARAYEKINNLPIKGKSVEWLKSRVKFDGFLEEMGEEVIEDILNLTIGTNYEERTLKNYVDKIVKTPEEWAIITGTIALQGGALSLTGNLLGDHMQQNGVPEEKILDVLLNSTEDEKAEYIDEAIKRGEIKINENAIQKRVFEVNKIKNKFFTQNLNAGVDEETALATATIESEAIANLAKNIGMSTEDVHKAFNINLQSMTDDEANAQYQNDTEALKGATSKNIVAHNQNIEENKVVDLSDDFKKAPTIDEVKSYINKIIEQGTKFATLSPEWFVDIKGGNRVKGKILNKGNYKHLDKMSNKRHKKYLMSLEKLLANAEYAGEKENSKKDKKPSVEKYHYFKTTVKIGNKAYEIIFDTEEYVNKNQLRSDYAKRNFKETEADTTSITNQNKDFNPKTVHLYNISEIKKPNIHFQDFDNIENARGFTYERKNFDGTTKDNLVVLLKGKANKSTLLHEFAHVYLTTLNNLALENDKAKDLLIKVNKFLRYNGSRSADSTGWRAEYTTAQHEKFANSFVAFVRTGKAPTYGLKRVFESFRKWLNDIYSDFQVSDIELSKEAQELFNELLGEATVEAQKKISQSIIERAQNNAQLKIQNEALKNEVNPVMFTGRQLRYRDTAYNILWYAISHNKEAKEFVKDKNQLRMILGNAGQNKKNKGLAIQKEKLEFVLREIGDVFSANDGFLDEWGEFFTDPGVNENPEANTELVMQAYDVIVNKKYMYDFEESYQELSDKDVQKAEYELDYIIDEYKNGKDENNKTNAQCAFFEWIEGQHPYIQEDLLNKWELKTNEIDRYQALNKFGQAKEDLKIYAATLKGRGDYSSQFAEFSRAILKRLDFMTELDKARIFNKLKDFNSFREIEQNLDDVMDYAETIAAVSERKQLADTIEREVKQTIHEWQNGIKKTKYTYPANKLFERLRKINNMKQEEIQTLYDAQVNGETLPSYVADEVNSETFYETIEKMFVTFKANGSYYNSTEFLTDLLNRIQSAKFSAKVARDELDFERRMQQINLIDECAKAIDNHKFNDKKNKAVKIAEKFNAHIMNLNGALQMIFNDAIKNKFSLDYLYAIKDGKVGRDRRIVLDKLKDVFDFKSDWQLFSKFIDMTKPEYEIKQRYTPDIQNGTIHASDIYNKETGQTKASIQKIMPEGELRSEWQDELIKLSKMEIIYYYIQSKNKTSYSMLTDMGDENTPPKGQFDKFEFDTMINSLTPQEMLMGDVLQMAAEKYYDGLNAYHIKKYHTDLGKVSCYFPRLSEIEDPRMLDVFNDYVMYNGKDSSQKKRTAGPGIRIKPANAVAVLFNHIEKANTIITMGEQLDLMNRVFNNSNLKKKIEVVFGDDVTQSFYQHITANLYSGQTALRSLQEQFFAKIANNAVKTQIFFKPQIGIKQLLSFMNYGKGDEYVSAGEWFKEFTKQTLTPKQWKKNIDFMFENEYLRDRYSRGGSMDALKRQLENRMFSKLSLLDELWGLPIQLGDIGAIIWGGKPYVDVLMQKGYTKEQAFKIFIETTVNDQQSSIPSTLSNAQREAKKQAFSTMMYAYQNTPYQYLRSCYTPIVKALQEGGGKNIKKAAKMFFIYGWLFPAIFNMASTLSIFTFMGGDDEQLKKDMGLAFLGLFGMLPIWGDMAKAIINGLVGDNYSGGTNYFVSATNRMNKLARHIEKDKVTPEDIWNAIVVVGEMSTGQPIGSMGNAASGIYDMTQGNVAKGALKALGYSDYRAKTVTGEK